MPKTRKAIVHTSHGSIIAHHVPDEPDEGLEGDDDDECDDGEDHCPMVGEFASIMLIASRMATSVARGVSITCDVCPPPPTGL